MHFNNLVSFVALVVSLSSIRCIDWNFGSTNANSQLSLRKSDSFTKNATSTWPGQNNMLPFLFQWASWTEEQIRRSQNQMWSQPSSNVGEFNQRSNALSLPLPNPETWSTWQSIMNRGTGGIERQWANWYMKPDFFGIEQETARIRQTARGKLPDGTMPVITNETFVNNDHQILVDILAGFMAGSSPRKVSVYNMRTFLSQYKRYYWVGRKFFDLDPVTKLDSFITCSYDVPKDIMLLYEVDNSRVQEILFQCIKYQETCCQLNCCDLRGRPMYYSTIVNKACIFESEVFFVTFLFYMFLTIINMVQ